MKYKAGDIVLLDYPEYFEVGKPYTIRYYKDSYIFIEVPFVANIRRIIGYYKPFSKYLERL